MIGQNLGLTFEPNFLIRTKNTKPQTRLKEEERKKNVLDAFKVTPNILVSQYPNILLFDDVWTSGSTLRESAKILKSAGAQKVWGLTLAR